MAASSRSRARTGRIVRPAAAVAHRRAIRPERRTRPPLADLKRETKVSDGLSPGGGRHHFFEADLLEHRVVEHRLGQQLLQLGVLVLQRLQALGVRHVEPAVLGLPLVKCRAADPVLAAHVRRLRPRLLLPQNPDDLLFRKPARPHVHPLAGDGLYPFLEEMPGLRSAQSSPFDGTYTSSGVLSDGFTHTETDQVTGLSAQGTHTFTSAGVAGSFTWTAQLSPTSDPNVDDLSGSGVIDNIGTRDFTLTGGVHLNANGTATLFWTGTDPVFGPIGWTTQAKLLFTQGDNGVVFSSSHGPAGRY